MLPMVKCNLGGWWPPGCGIVSQANDNFASSVTAYIAGILESMASWMWSFISGAFGVSNIDASEWTIVSGLTNWWIVVMMTPLVVVMIIQLISGLVSQQPRRIGRALLGGALAVPLVFLATSLMSKLSNFTDSASTALLATLGTDPYMVFMRLFGFQRAPAGSGRQWDVVSLSTGTAGGPAGSVVVTVLAVLVVWVLSFILMCSMIFRSFALIVLAAVAPVALMLLPWERTKSWSRLWCETVIALLIAKPLAATVLAVAVKLFANSTSFSGLASGAVGMVLACGAPLMALKLVSFAGGEIAGAAQMAGGGHVASRVGNFTGRQVGRQFGGKIHLSGIGSHGPTPVASMHPNVSTGTNTTPLRPPSEASGGPGNAGTAGGGASSQPSTSTAWPMPPAASKSGRHGPSASSTSGEQPETAPPQGPTTSRYPGRRNSPQSAGHPPPGPTSPASTPPPPPHPGAPYQSGPASGPTNGAPVSGPPVVGPSRIPPRNTSQNGDGKHE
ncbi:type IV secretion system protein [Arthrobacter sp. STN4]|uniref:type IV secretion system protein n=1 Tax=Arthrobacter sp. STN4 TaxID=2923276 RepID=UPI00211A5C17|nr:type IV secretion system protein [Arthrobacter sp. STN4]MCQ9163928.1 type IV secretion system protein [Arthrobacter sp. STN4]